MTCPRWISIAAGIYLDFLTVYAVIIIVWSLIKLFVEQPLARLGITVGIFILLTAVNIGNNLAITPSYDEQQLRPEDENQVNTEAASDSIDTETTGGRSYTEFHTGLGHTEFDGDVIELDDLDTEEPESSTSSPRAPSSRPRSRSNSVRQRTRSESRARRESEDTVASRATSREYPPSQQSQTSLFGARRRRRPDDTESRGSEVYRLEPYDPYYRRRAASVPALRSGIGDR